MKLWKENLRQSSMGRSDTGSESWTTSVDGPPQRGKTHL